VECGVRSAEWASRQRFRTASTFYFLGIKAQAVFLRPSAQPFSAPICVKPLYGIRSAEYGMGSATGFPGGHQRFIPERINAQVVFCALLRKPYPRKSA
jgi:hypothetical protein